MNQIVGHNDVRHMLQKWIEEERVGHAYLFVGRDGIGKKLVAIDFARQMMEQGQGEYCESDFVMIAPENNLIKVECIRDVIEEIYLKPTNANRKVIIIDEADKMNPNAQNALLKVLEEPPLYATIILITSHEDKIIKTILSRVTKVVFGALTEEELAQIVGQKVDNALARGSASKAFSLLEDYQYQPIKLLQQCIETKDYLEMNRQWNTMKAEAMDPLKVLEMLKWLYYGELRERPKDIANKMEWLEEAIQEITRNVNADLSMDKLFIRMSRV